MEDGSPGGPMAKFLFTMLPADDLGLPTRLAPIARALADHGHEVAVFKPFQAAEAGLQDFPMPSRPMPGPPGMLKVFAALYFDEESTRGQTTV
jgi:hypothetical protein